MTSGKILVIEDEKMLSDILKFRLEHEGYEVIIAYDGMEGLEKAKNEKPDLIILDLMLPKMDGYKLCRMIKFDRNYQNIPIIMLTAKTQKHDQQLGYEVGADAYFTKPYDEDALAAKVRELLNK